MKPRRDLLPRIPITLSLLPLVPLQKLGKIMNKEIVQKNQNSSKVPPEERKIKATISLLVLLRKGPESIAL